MPPAPAHLSFLPWVRQGAAAAISTVETLTSALAGAASLTANVSVNGAAPRSVPLRLRGPADVVGIDVRQIVRMEPRPGTTDFEPNYFACIEFDRPDFPWLFTPARADAQARLRPWLCLVVVREQPGVSVRSTSDTPLPVLEIAAPAVPADELPDLGESWAWAHAQAASGGSAEPDVRAALQGRPELALSRLLCPRLLAANTGYVACVVPAFALGVKAGLGQEIGDNELTGPNGLAPAWSLAPAPASVRLPVYHHWRFRTGEGGDFESLVRLLRALPAPAGLGTRPIDVSRPGFHLPANFPPGVTLALEGALRPLVPDAEPSTWTSTEKAVFQAALASIVNAPGLAQELDPAGDPLLAPPLYGRWHAARATVSPGAAPWLDELNLDPRHRVAAAFGTRVVQEHQEALMAAAWEQAADLQRANQRLRLLQLSLVVGTSLHARHFMRLTDGVALRVSAPALGRLRSSAAPATSMTAIDQLAGSVLPVKATSPAMRRIGRERGPLTRRVSLQGGARTAQTSWIVKLNTAVALSFVSAPWWDVASFGMVRERVAQPSSLRRYSEVTDATVTNVFGRPVFQIVADGQPVAVQGLNNLPPGADSPTAHQFRLAAREHLTRIRPGRPGMLFAPPPSLDLGAVRTSVQTQLEPRRALVALAQALVTTDSASATPAVRPEPAAPVPIEPVMAAPRFVEPMYEPLRDLSQELLLPGIDAVEPNTVLGLMTNRRFIEAYMVGLNVEMARELLWRGYPTDQRGTYFDRFWDARSTSPGVDIFPLHGWGDRALGSTQSAPAGDRFVVLLRSDLLRRYPGAIIYATRAVKINGVRTPSADPADEVLPMFRGTLPPDISFFGFNMSVNKMVGGGGGGGGGGQHEGYFIIIQEQPGEPRFGLDVDTPVGAGTHLRVGAGAPPGMPLGGLQWGRNSAHMAGITRQQPVRVAIHASQFIPAT